MTTEDWPRLAGWLSARGHTLGTGDVAQFDGGIANLNYLVELDGVPAVFRRPPPGPTAEGANDMAREWRVLSRLHEAYPLAPRGLFFCDDLSVVGAPFQLIEYKPGVAIGATLPKGLSVEAPPLLTSGLIDAMARLHAVDPASVGLSDLGKPDGFLLRQVEGWARRAAVVWPGQLPGAAEYLIAKLGSSVPIPTSTSLLHMDLKFNNVLFDLDALSINAVIDWDMATRGCPLFDVGVLLSYWVEPSDPAGVRGLNQVPSLERGFATRAEVAAAYFSATQTPPTSMHWYVACARLRLAVAWMQLYRRWESGAVVGDIYEGFERIALAVLEWGATLFDEGKT